MIARILKFPLEVTGRQSVLMSDGAQLLYVEMQHGTPTLWAICDERSPKPRTILIFGTGHDIFEGVAHAGNYIGTCIDWERNRVWHVFDGGAA